MENIQRERGHRGWDTWDQLKCQLDDAYKDEKAFWAKKSRVE